MTGEAGGGAGRLASAMVLAAGRGTRLLPLTLESPKPLMPFLGRPLIARAFDALRAAGFSRVVVNVHHHAAQMRDVLAGVGRFGVEVVISDESGEGDEPLGTGGGLLFASRLFGEGPVVVLNADTLLELDVAGLLAAHERAHRERGAVATMVMRAPVAGERYTPCWVDLGAGAGARVVRIDTGGASGGGVIGGGVIGGGAMEPPTGCVQRVFVGAQVIERGLIEGLPRERKDPCIVRDGYVAAIGRGEVVAAYEYAGVFSDLGTPGRLARAAFGLMGDRETLMRGGFFGVAGEGAAEVEGAGEGVVLVHPTAKVEAGAVLEGPVVVERDVWVEAGARVGPRAWLHPGVRVGAGARVSEAVMAVVNGVQVTVGL